MTEIVAKQPHHHHHPVQTPTTVSLETHQSERGGTANTTIAATTHHLHEMEVSTLKVIHTDYYSSISSYNYVGKNYYHVLCLCSKT